MGLCYSMAINVPTQSTPSVIYKQPLLLRILICFVVLEVVAYAFAKIVSFRYEPFFIEIELMFQYAIILVLVCIGMIKLFRIDINNFNKMSNKVRNFAIIISISFIAFGGVFISQYGYKWVIHSLLKTHGATVKAKVEEITLYSSTSNFHLRKVNSIYKADLVKVKLTYAGKTSIIGLDRGKMSDPGVYGSLYSEMINSREITVRYYPNFPEIVRPDAEFTNPILNPYFNW